MNGGGQGMGKVEAGFGSYSDLQLTQETTKEEERTSLMVNKLHGKKKHLQLPALDRLGHSFFAGASTSGGDLLQIKAPSCDLLEMLTHFLSRFVRCELDSASSSRIATAA